MSEACKLSKTVDITPLHSIPTWTRELSEYEYYLLAVGSTISEFLSSLEYLQHTSYYLNEFRPTKRQREAGITHYCHIQYHTEAFIIRAASLYDRVLILVDAIFHLGIDSRYITHDIIVSNAHIKSSKILPTLKALKKIVDKYRDPRNTVIHRQSYTDNELRLIAFYSILNQETDEEKTYELQCTYMTKRYVADKQKEIAEFYAKLEDKLFTLFTELAPYYTYNCTLLQKLDSST